MIVKCEADLSSIEQISGSSEEGQVAEAPLSGIFLWNGAHYLREALPCGEALKAGSCQMGLAAHLRAGYRNLRK